MNLFKVIRHLRKPNFAIAALTRRCNARCPACDMWKASDTMDLEKFAAVGLDRLRAAGFGIVEYTGGEVTLLAGLAPLIRASRERGFMVQLMTNGTVMSEGLARQLGASGVNLVNVSVDHHEEAVAAAYRGFPGINARIAGTVRLLREQGILLCSSTLIARHNHKDIERVVEFVNGELGIWFSFCVPQVADKLPLGSELSRSALTRGELIEACERILDMKRAGYWILNSAAYIKDLLRWLRGEPVKFLCRAGRNIVYIDWNMDVYPCFIGRRMCHLSELEGGRLVDLKCNACGFQCFREPSIFYRGLGKLALLRDVDVFRAVLPKLRVG